MDENLSQAILNAAARLALHRTLGDIAAHNAAARYSAETRVYHTSIAPLFQNCAWRCALTCDSHLIASMLNAKVHSGVYYQELGISFLTLRAANNVPESLYCAISACRAIAFTTVKNDHMGGVLADVLRRSTASMSAESIMDWAFHQAPLLEFYAYVLPVFWALLAKEALIPAHRAVQELLLLPFDIAESLEIEPVRNLLEKQGINVDRVRELHRIWYVLALEEEADDEDILRAAHGCLDALSKEMSTEHLEALRASLVLPLLRAIQLNDISRKRTSALISALGYEPVPTPLEIVARFATDPLGKFALQRLMYYRQLPFAIHEAIQLASSADVSPRTVETAAHVLNHLVSLETSTPLIACEDLSSARSRFEQAQRLSNVPAFHAIAQDVMAWSEACLRAAQAREHFALHVLRVAQHCIASLSQRSQHPSDPLEIVALLADQIADYVRAEYLELVSVKAPAISCDDC